MLPGSAVPLRLLPLLRVDGRRGRRHAIDGGAALAAGVARRIGGRGVDHGSIRQRRGRGEAPVAAAVGGDLANRVAVAIGQSHAAARLGGAAERGAVAGVDHWRGRGYRVHGDTAARTGVAGGVGGRGVDHGAVGQRRGRSEAPVAAAVGGDLPYRVAVAVGQGHGSARLGGTAERGAVARVDHWRGRCHGVHGDAGRRTGVAGRVGSRGVDHRAVGQRRARGEGPVAAAVGGDLANRIAVAVGQGHGSARLGGAAEGRTVARIDGGRGRRDGIHGNAGRRTAVAGGIPGHHVDHGTVRQRGGRRERPVAVGIGGGLADRIAIAVGQGHAAARFGSPAEFAAVARLDHRRARRHAVDGDGGRRAAVAGGVPGHHIDHGAIRQLATGGEAPVAVGIGAGLADPDCRCRR